MGKKSIWKKIGIFFFILFITFSLIALYSHFIGTTGLQVKEYKITNSKIPDSFYGFKIAHISDIHYGRTIHKKELKKLVDKINLLKPDLVVLTGDLLDQEETLSDQDIQDIIQQLKRIDATIGKFAISGENDYQAEAWSTIIKDSNFINLNDTYELIYYNGEEPILLAGLSTNLKGTKNAKDKISPINNFIQSVKDSEDMKAPRYKILIMHEPDYITDIAPNNYDLILAGHSHNGQICLPVIGGLFQPNGAKQYHDEYYQLNNTDLYISSGLGTSRFDFRLWNRPSVNFYRIVNK